MAEDPFKDPDTVTGDVWKDFQEIENMHQREVQREMEEDFDLGVRLSSEEKTARNKAKEIRNRIRAMDGTKMTHAQKRKRTGLEIDFIAHRTHIVKEKGDIVPDHYQKLLQEYIDFEKSLKSQ